MGLGVGRGLVNLFKQWGKGIGNAADHVWLREDAQKAIRDEITKKYQPKIDRVLKGESRKADNIKDLGDKVTQSKKDLADAQKAWQDKYDNALAGAKNQRQADIAAYNAQLKTYSDALADAKAGRQSILDQLRDSEAHYDPSRTMFTDVNTGENYIFDPFNGGYRSLNSLTKKERKKFLNNYGNFDTRLIDLNANPSGRIINAFDKSNIKNYKGNSTFDNYYSNRISPQSSALRNADNEINRANSDLTNWKKQSQPQDWDDNVDLNPFEADFKKNNGELPTEYSFNGQNYTSKSGLKRAYQKALDREQNKRNLFKKKASNYASERDAEIAQRIQDAKDMNKAKLALAGTLGAGALYAGAKAMYGGDDTDNTDNINNIDNTDNTDYGKPDPEFKAENTPEGKAGLNGKSIDTGFDPDEADAVATLAAAAHDKGVEDSNSIESSDDLGNNIAATTGGHTIDDRLFELLKNMEDSYKADAIANYIYSRHGDDPEVQNLGWRGWLNKYYGDSLRSLLGIDPSGYKGMHISGGL